MVFHTLIHMPTTRRFLLNSAFVGFLGCSSSLYGQAQGATPATESNLQKFKSLQDQLHNPRLIGKGKYSFWGFDVYYASLWSTESVLHPNDWQDRQLALELLYLRDFEGKDIAKRSIDEMDKQNPIQKDKADSWLSILQKTFPPVHKGDSLIGVYHPDLGAQFFFNDKPIGVISELELAKRFFAIWLSPQTSAPDLRRKLFDTPS